MSFQPQTTTTDAVRPGLLRRLVDFGRRMRNRLFGRKSKKNPNIYPLY